MIPAFTVAQRGCCHYGISSGLAKHKSRVLLPPNTQFKETKNILSCQIKYQYDTRANSFTATDNYSRPRTRAIGDYSRPCTKAIGDYSRPCVKPIGDYSRPCVSAIGDNSRPCASAIGDYSRPCVSAIGDYSRPCVSAIGDYSPPCDSRPCDSAIEIGRASCRERV